MDEWGRGVVMDRAHPRSLYGGLCAKDRTLGCAFRDGLDAQDRAAACPPVSTKRSSEKAVTRRGELKTDVQGEFTEAP